MGFSTHCFNTPELSRLTRWAGQLVRWSGLVLWCLLNALPAKAQTISAESLRLHKSEEGVFVSANLRFDLAPVVEEALRKGIPLVFTAQAELVKDRWYWYDKPIGSAQRHMRLSYQPLTRHWRLQTYTGPGSADASLSQTYESLSEALSAIKTMQRFKVAEWAELDADARYTMEFRFKLDTAQLPRLFLIGASNASEWNMSFAQSIRWVHDGKSDGNR